MHTSWNYLLRIFFEYSVFTSEWKKIEENWINFQSECWAYRYGAVKPLNSSNYINRDIQMLASEHVHSIKVFFLYEIRLINKKEWMLNHHKPHYTLILSIHIIILLQIIQLLKLIIVQRILYIMCRASTKN